MKSTTTQRWGGSDAFSSFNALPILGVWGEGRGVAVGIGIGVSGETTREPSSSPSFSQTKPRPNVQPAPLLL